MKSIKFKELLDKDITTLTKLLKDKKMELFDSKLKLKTMQLTNHSSIYFIRKDIAKIKTALQQKNEGI